MYCHVQNLLRTYEFKMMVLTSDLKPLLNHDWPGLEREKECLFRDDARSAAFFALGAIKTSGKPVLLVTSAEMLPNMLSAVVEAHYQSLPLFLVALGKGSELEFATPFLRYAEFRSLDEMSAKTPLNIENPIVNHPCLWFLKGSFPEPVTSISAEESMTLSAVLELADSSVRIVTDIEPSGKQISVAESKGITIFSRNSAYGLVSYFWGHAVSCRETAFLIADYRKILLDANAFSLRFIPENAVIIGLQTKDGSSELQQWVMKSGCSFFSITKAAEISECLSEKSRGSIVIEQLIKE